MLARRTLLLAALPFNLAAAEAAAKELATVLIVVTSADKLPGGKATGLWLEEYALPYQLFRQAGCRVVVASPKGGAAPVDAGSLAAGEGHPEWQEARQELLKTRILKELAETRYDAIFIPGGHGATVDLPVDPSLLALLARHAEAKRPLAAVCHGPAALVGVRLADGKALVAGRRVAAFSDAEEKAVGLDKAVPFLLETRLRELGAKYSSAALWQPHVESDGFLVTGQNPASSRGCAEALLKLLGKG
ncbi:MAG: hypothetical protein RL095_4207 [Verrucomicrobiota bacterium]|jgi:putative intracellular protease/amidase